MIGSCFTPRVPNSLMVSGIKSVSNLYSLSLNIVVKSLGSSSDSYRHDLSLSARAVISGTCTFSDSSGSSLTFLSNSASPSASNHLKIASWIF